MQVKLSILVHCHYICSFLEWALTIQWNEIGGQERSKVKIKERWGRKKGKKRRNSEVNFLTHNQRKTKMSY